MFVVVTEHSRWHERSCYHFVIFRDVRASARVSFRYAVLITVYGLPFRWLQLILAMEALVSRRVQGSSLVQPVRLVAHCTQALFSLDSVEYSCCF